MGNLASSVNSPNNIPIVFKLYVQSSPFWRVSELILHDPSLFLGFGISSSPSRGTNTSLATPASSAAVRPFRGGTTSLDRHKTPNLKTPENPSKLISFNTENNVVFSRITFFKYVLKQFFLVKTNHVINWLWGTQRLWIWSLTSVPKLLRIFEHKCECVSNKFWVTKIKNESENELLVVRSSSSTDKKRAGPHFIANTKSYRHVSQSHSPAQTPQKTEACQTDILSGNFHEPSSGAKRFPLHVQTSPNLKP